VPARRIGTVGGADLVVETLGSTPRTCTWKVADLHQAWDGALDSYLS
jgi:hypothetical protein